MASIRKRGGRFQAQVRRQGYAPTSSTFTRLSDAQQWTRQVELQADRRELAPDKSILEHTTLADLVTRYRDTVVPALKGAARETITLNAFLREPMCRKTLAELTTSDFSAYRDEHLKRVTPKSLKRMLSPINHMFRLAHEEWGFPLTNPLTALRLKVTDNKRQRRLQDGELHRLIEAANQTRNPYTLLVVRFAIETAMRRGEILALRWCDIDLSRQSATVREAKNGHPRVIPLTSAAMNILDEAHTLGNEGVGILFPVSANGLRLSWQRLVRRAGISDLHFHDLRHEAISRLFEIGLTSPEVASISGHRDLRMLGRYAHANHQLIREKMNTVPESSSDGVQNIYDDY